MVHDNKNLSPSEKEAAKTKKERGEDIAYTLNHSLVCTATDFIDPFIGNFVQKKLGNKSQLANCWSAEIIGDFGSVPVTIAMQRFFPGVMSGLSNLAEPLFHNAFMKGAKRDTAVWAAKHGYSDDSNEYKHRIEKIYNYEVEHISQALMWTGSSIVLNVMAQRALKNPSPISHIAAGKIGGALLTGGITVGGRMLFPRKAEALDKYTSEKILMPIKNKIDNKLDLDDDDKHHHTKTSKYSRIAHDTNWKKRIEIDKGDKSPSTSI